MSLEEFLSTPRKKQDDSPISKLQDKLESANLELADSKSKSNTLKLAIERLISENNNLKFQSECATDFKNSLANQLKDLQPIINEKEHLSKQLDLTKSLLDNTTQNFKLVEIRASQLDSINYELKEKNSALNDDISQLTKESNSHKSSSEHLAKKLIELNSANDELRTKIIDLTHSKNQLQADLNRLSTIELNFNSLSKKYKNLNCHPNPEQFTSNCGTCLSCLHENLIKESNQKSVAINDYIKQTQELLIKNTKQNDELDAAHFQAQDAKEQNIIDSIQSNKKLSSLSTELDHKNKELIKLSVSNNKLSTNITYYLNLVHTLVDNLTHIANSSILTRKSIAKKSIAAADEYMNINLPSEPYKFDTNHNYK